MIVAVGIDLVQINRVKKLIETYPDQLNRVFTEKELKAINQKQKVSRLSELFAAKEAVFKVLGTGWQNGIGWTDIEIAKSEVQLKGLAQTVAKQLQINSIQIDMSCTKTTAVAQAIGLK